MNTAAQRARRLDLAALGAALLALVTLTLPAPAPADVDLPTQFSNSGGIANTRHNLAQRGRLPGQDTINNPGIMDPYRNDYGEVCVYCHTPHGANSTLTAPLWNRTMPTTPYQTYAALGSTTLTQPVSEPGVNSLTCLSCHDGTLAVDSIINMPNVTPSGEVSPNFNTDANRDTAQNLSFLNGWNNEGTDATQHLGLDAQNPGNGCLACHSADAGVVGVRYPSPGPNVDFNIPTVSNPEVAFFDDGNGRVDTDEVRLYDTGEGYEVECASCHDPHGVPSGGPGTNTSHNPSFLRVDNSGSSLCLTCHTK